MAFDAERASMVRTQIEARGLRDGRVLDAMRMVPRHLFVPECARSRAYADQALAIGAGQTISQPLMVAIMTAALGLGGDERVLEVGTGSGYQAAILAQLAREVVTVERLPHLAAAATERLAALGCRNVRVIVADGSAGYAPAAPYQGIIVTAGAPRVPDPLRQQLADGGRLVIPVGTSFHQDLLVVQRSGDVFTETVREACVFVPLVGEHAWRE